jgi:hypothetical protein
MRAALLTAVLLLSGCVNFVRDSYGRWPHGTAFAAAAPLSGSARPMDYYARRWSQTDLGPAFGWKLLDREDARAKPWAPQGQRWSGTLAAMRAANEAEAARLSLTGQVRLSPGPDGLMPLEELAASAEFQAEPWTYLPWYRLEAGSAGPWSGELLVGRQLRLLGRPDLARRHQSGLGFGIVGATALGVGLVFAQLSAYLPYPPWVATATIGCLGGGALTLGGSLAEKSAVDEFNESLERLRAPPRPGGI